MVLRRAPLRHGLGLLLVVAGVVVLDDVILAAEESDDGCGGRRDGCSVRRQQLSLTHISAPHLKVGVGVGGMMEGCSQRWVGG